MMMIPLLQRVILNPPLLSPSISSFETLFFASTIFRSKSLSLLARKSVLKLFFSPPLSAITRWF